MFGWTGLNNQTTQQYVYLGGSLLAIVDRAWPAQTINSLKYQHTDALGTPVAETDAAGNVVQRSEYDPYGRLNNRPLTNGPGYTGHYQDAATGMTYMQQRYYDPVIGRMLSRDPVTAYSSGDMRFFNGYAYAFNNPYTMKDPDGRHSCNGSTDDCKKVDQYVDKIKESKTAPNIKPNEAKQIQKVITYLGKKGEGPTITPTALPKNTKASTDQRDNIKIDVNKNNPGSDPVVYGAMALGHEAQHNVYAKANGESHGRAAATVSEKNAYGVEALIGRGLGVYLSPTAIDAAVKGSIENQFGPEVKDENP